MRKACAKCKSKKIVKNGKRADIQRVLCKNCGYLGEIRKLKSTKNENNLQLFDQYVRDEAKYRQLGLAENVSIRTIQTRLDSIEFKKNL